MRIKIEKRAKKKIALIIIVNTYMMTHLNPSLQRQKKTSFASFAPYQTKKIHHILLISKSWVKFVLFVILLWTFLSLLRIIWPIFSFLRYKINISYFSRTIECSFEILTTAKYWRKLYRFEYLSYSGGHVVARELNSKRTYNSYLILWWEH